MSRDPVRSSFMPLLASVALLLGCQPGGGGPTISDSTPGEIHGTVLDQETGTPLAGVLVDAEPGGESVRTGVDGRFTLVVPIGTGPVQIQVTATAEGYEGGQSNVTLSPDQRTAQVALALTREIVEPGSPVEPTAPADSIEIRVVVDDAVRCVAPGARLEYHVEMANRTPRPLVNVAIEDTLDGEFQRDLGSGDVHVSAAAGANSDLRIHPDGRSFRLTAERVDPTGADFVRLFSVGLPAATIGGVWCNVAAASVGGDLLRDQTCIATLLIFEVDLSNEDGVLVNGDFDPAPETFSLGDGGPGSPDGLIYEIEVRNSNCYPITNVVVTDSVSPMHRLVEFREIVPGYPSAGGILTSGPEGLVWTIERIEPDETVALRFRAEAVGRGQDVNRVRFRSDEIPTDLINQETTVIQ